MKQFSVFYLFLTVSLVIGTTLSAETTLDALQHDLDSFKVQQAQTSQQNFAVFLDQTAKGAASPDAALDLYIAAGGIFPPVADAPPPPKPPNPDEPPKPKIPTSYEPPTPEELKKKVKLDNELAAQKADWGPVLQVHCGLLRFAGQFVFAPTTPDLQKQFVDWLKVIAPAYPQMAHVEIRKITMDQSIIAGYLNMKYWPEKTEQGQWTVDSLPDLYQKLVLQPLQDSHSPDVLPAWDNYIAMRQADALDLDNWANLVQPDLLYQRGMDDYALQPSVDKLTALVLLVKQHPLHPKAPQMIAQLAELIKKSQGGDGGGSGSGSVSATTGGATPPSSSTLVPQADSTNNAPIREMPVTNPTVTNTP